MDMTIHEMEFFFLSRKFFIFLNGSFLSLSIDSKQSEYLKVYTAKNSWFKRVHAFSLLKKTSCKKYEWKNSNNTKAMF